MHQNPQNVVLESYALTDDSCALLLVCDYIHE